MSRLTVIVRGDFDRIADDLTKRILGDGRTKYATLPFEQMRERILPGLRALLLDLEQNQAKHFGDFWASRSYTRLRQGFDVTDMQHAISVTEQGLTERCYEDLPAASERRLALDRIYGICEAARSALYTAFVQAQSQRLSEQAAMIRRLSTPILPLHEGVLVLPLVGEIDAERAGQITTQLLAAISAHGADVVILDVTGVPDIDADIAGYLVRTAQSASLLGARVILAGIGAGIARTMVELGIELRGIATCGTLKAAVVRSFAELGLVVRASGAALPASG